MMKTDLSTSAAGNNDAKIWFRRVSAIGRRE